MKLQSNTISKRRVLAFLGITRPLIPLLVRLSTHNTWENCELTENSHLVAKNLQKTFRVQPSFAVFEFSFMVFVR